MTALTRRGDRRRVPRRAPPPSRFLPPPPRPTPATNTVRYLGVELGPEGASEWADRRRVVHVPRPAVTRIELCRGIAGERPLLQLVFGFAACILGLALLASDALHAAQERFGYVVEWAIEEARPPAEATAPEEPHCSKQ